MDFTNIYNDPRYLELARQSRTLYATQKLIQNDLNKFFNVPERVWGMQSDGTPRLFMIATPEELGQ